MKKAFLSFLTVTLFITTGAVSARAQGNAKVPDEVEESTEIVRNLDSLLNLWYVKSSTPARNKKAANIRGFQPEEVPTYSDSVYAARIRKLETPLPLVYNSKVKAFIDLYAVRKREQVEKMLGLSQYYFPIMEATLDKHNMPLEIKYLSVVESALNPRAVSRVGATGLWQFMYPTGRLYNLEVTSYIDMRKDPIRSTEAAASYLYDLHKIFDDWFLAIAAYNCGPGNVNKAIRRSGGKHTFWEIYNYLPKETRGYVPAFIAATYVFSYHQEHNLYPQQVNLPMMVDTIVVDEEISFEPIARVLGIPVEMLQDLNPQYKRNVVPVRSQPYTLRMPAAKAAAYCTLHDSIYVCYRMMNGELAPTDSKDDDDDKKTVAQAKPAASADDNSASSGKSKLSYTVKSGDHLGLIADLYDISIYSLRRWNGIRGSTIYAGQRLTVYVPSEKLSYYKKINTMTAYQKKKVTNGGSVDEAPVRTVATKPAPASSSGSYSYYTVQKGDTLWGIAKRYPGVSVDDIKKMNNLSDGDIRAGMKLKIKKS